MCRIFSADLNGNFFLFTVFLRCLFSFFQYLVMVQTWPNFFFDLAREVLDRRVQVARGFPPRGKWTYGEVFHPAVVPQPLLHLKLNVSLFY